MRETLIEARRILVEDGWCQEKLCKEGSYCIAGSIYKAMGYSDRVLEESDVSDDDYRKVGRMLDYVSLDNFGHVVNMAEVNDNEETTSETMIGLLDNTIQSLESEPDVSRGTS